MIQVLRNKVKFLSRQQKRRRNENFRPLKKTQLMFILKKNAHFWPNFLKKLSINSYSQINHKACGGLKILCFCFYKFFDI